jgi:hypothetical protein
MCPTPIALEAAAKAVTDLGVQGKIVVTGLGNPASDAQLLTSGQVPAYVLWSPVDLGYLSYYAAKAVFDGKITGKDGETFDAGRLGTKTVGAVGGAPGEVTVPWSTRSGTATDGKDYTAGKGTLSWGRDDTAVKEISIPIMDNNEENKEKTFSVSLGPPTGGAVLGRPNQAMVIILDDDGPGYVRFEKPMYSVLEPEKFAKVNVVREAGRRGKISVVCTVAGGSAKAGVNYKETTQTLTWNDGDTKPKTLLVPMIWPDRTVAGGGRGEADDILSVKADTKKKDEPGKKADPKKKDTGKEEE